METKPEAIPDGYHTVTPFLSVKDSLKAKKWFEASLSDYADKTAVSFLRNGRLETLLSYRELNQDSNRCAAEFKERGVEKGDRVILFLNKSIFFVVAHLALQKIGAVAVPLNPGFTRAEMDYLVTDSDPKLVIADFEKSDMLAKMVPAGKLLSVDTRIPYVDSAWFRFAPAVEMEAELEPTDPALIIYTSGTTGSPKGAVLTQRNLAHDAKNIIDIWRITPDDILCHALPLFHIHGLCFALHTALLAGAGVVMLDRFDPETVLRVLAAKDCKESCTVFMAVPTMYTRLMEALGEKRRDFGHIRLWTSGSAPLLVKEFERIEAVFGKPPVEREGMSESGMNFSNPLQGERKPGSIGRPLPGLKAKIMDLYTLTEVRRGQIGEIWLKSPSITPGYWRKPEATAKAFVDGWFRTGDLGKVDADGYYYLTDRIKHIIITGGENVSAKEVETVIHQMQGVSESVVVGVPDEKWGEKVAAAVVAESPGRLESPNPSSWSDGRKRPKYGDFRDFACSNIS